MSFTGLKDSGTFVAELNDGKLSPIHILVRSTEPDLLFGYSYTCKPRREFKDVTPALIKQKLGVEFNDKCEFINESRAALLSFFENSSLFTVDFEIIAIRLSEEAGRKAFTKG